MQNWLIHISFQKENPTFLPSPQKNVTHWSWWPKSWSKPKFHVKKHGIWFSPRYVLRVHPESGSSEGSGHPEGGRSGKLPWKPVIRISFSKHCNTKKKKPPRTTKTTKKKSCPILESTVFFWWCFFSKTPTTETQIPCPSRISNYQPSPPPPASLLSPQTIARRPTWKKSPAPQAHPPDPHRHHLRLGLGNTKSFQKSGQKVDEFFKTISADFSAIKISKF